MGVFSRVFGAVRGRFGGGPIERARREEALGHLEDATALYVEAGAHLDAARLFALRAETATDPRDRLRLLSQACSVADRLDSDDGKAEARRLTTKRARLALDLAKSRTLRLTPSELQDIGATLENLEEPSLAAEAYALAGDVEAQTRSLVAAGAIERLEEVLEAQQSRRRTERRRQQLAERIRDSILAGNRREALQLAEDSGADDELLADLVTDIRARRVVDRTLELELDGEPTEVAFGDSIVIGRKDATVVVPSPSVSRAHLGVRRRADGYEAFDLGSSNGTTLGGARLDVPIAVGEGIEVKLGGDVPVAIRPVPGEGGVLIEVAGRSIHAPLGALDVGGVRVAPAEDGWLEVGIPRGETRVLEALKVEGQVQLCVGDVLRDRVDGPVRLRVLG